jgi:hypothetical protein
MLWAKQRSCQKQGNNSPPALQALVSQSGPERPVSAVKSGYFSFKAFSSEVDTGSRKENASN